MNGNPPLRAGFLMDQIAGHITSYRNMRPLIDDDPTIDASWFEIEYARPGGAIEVWSERLRVIPPYVTGVTRGTVELRRGLRAGPFDVLFTNCSVASLSSRPFRHTPTLLHLDSTPVQIDRMPSYPSPHDIKPVAALKRSMSSRLFRSAAAVHAWSNWARRSFIDDYGVDADRVIVNPPGIDTALWQRPSPLTATNDSVRVLFVGADFARKGGSMLLDWHRRQDPARITLVIATRDEVPSTAGVEVHRGLSPNSPELRKLFHGADLFALPSAGECFGIATVEAMAAGLPVIASDAGGSADIIDDGVNGAIVRAGDQSSLDAALDHLSSSGDARVTFGAASAVRARQLFDVHTTAARTIESLHSIAGSRPALRST